MNLFPAVKHIVVKEGKLNLLHGIPFRHNDVSKKAKAGFISNLFHEVTEADEVMLLFHYNSTLHEEGYEITIDHDGINLTYKTEKGIFYGIKTIRQICYQSHEVLPFLEIKDEPELNTRGFMLDISRNKIPELKTLKDYVDLLSEINYNHFELYVEGLSYLYPTFEHLYQAGKTPLTPKEYKALERYAKAHMIDLVPCHNGLGHMTEWLTHYPELAVVPDGMFFWGAHRAPSTINPLDPKSIELVKSFYQDALKNTSSQYFHMNLDEPYELGHGKTEDEAKKIGVGEMYLNYVLKLSDFMAKHKKTPLIWGDVLNHYPETIERLPKDIIFVDWGYDLDYPFHKTLKRLGDLKVKFMAAPGTSTWNSFTGRTQTMFENIRQACVHTKLNHGEGMLLTEWGDNGHMQTLPMAIPAIVYGGMESWHASMDNRYKLRHFINQYVVTDRNLKVGDLLLEMGRYSELEDSYTYNGTKLNSIIYAAKHLDPHDLQGTFFYQFRHHVYGRKDVYSIMSKRLDQWVENYEKIHARHKQGQEIKEEIGLSLFMVRTFITLIRMQADDITNTEYKEMRKDLLKSYPELLKSYEKIWLNRNKKGGLEESMAPLKVIGEVIKLQPFDGTTRNPALRREVNPLKRKTVYLN